LMTAMLFDHIQSRRCWHIILTIRHGHGPLGPQLRHLFDCFISLRSKSCWTTQIVGGARFLDVTFNSIKHLWGPHLHVLAEAIEINTTSISKTWMRLTGGSHQVKCRLVSNTRKDRLGTCQYITKPPFESFAHDEGLVHEYQLAIKCGKPARGFGTWHKLKLLPRRRVHSNP
jgi:hypothetical protein